MGKYGRAATMAATSLAGSKSADPRAAWTSAVTGIFPDSPSSQTKGCPRDSFLGLCSMGAVVGVPPGNYTRSVKNKGYVSRALMELRSNPHLADDEDRLWEIATNGAGKAPNHQIEVLVALWRNRQIR